MNLAQKIAKESTITFSGLVYGNINRLLYTALLASWVGVEYLGIYSLANSIILISEVLGKMGLETGVMRFISRLDTKKDYYKIQNIILSSLKMTCIFSIGLTLLIIAGTGWLVTEVLNEPPLLKTVLIVFALTMPFNVFLSISAFATQGFKLMKYTVFATQFVKPTVLFGGMVLSYSFISKESALMLPHALAGIISCILMFKYLRKLSGINLISVLFAPFDKPLLMFSFTLMYVFVKKLL